MNFVLCLCKDSLGDKQQQFICKIMKQKTTSRTWGRLVGIRCRICRKFKFQMMQIIQISCVTFIHNISDRIYNPSYLLNSTGSREYKENNPENQFISSFQKFHLYSADNIHNFDVQTFPPPPFLQLLEGNHLL